MSWDVAFDEPIDLPNGKKAINLRQAAQYVMGLPKAEADHPKWQTAMHVLMEAAENRGPISFARLGMVQAIMKDVEPRFGPGERVAKETH
jgi:hypothetical protein